MRKLRVRRSLLATVVTFIIGFLVFTNLPTEQYTQIPDTGMDGGSAVVALEALAVKGRAPKTGYERSLFGDGWKTVQGCDTRQIILNRDMKDTVVDDQCRVVSGVLQDPYTGQEIRYSREKSAEVQIDHVVALSDAWQKGAQQLTREQRVQLANDPLELLAVDGPANMKKSDADAATWLPSNQDFRCEYISRQIAVKKKYNLWITEAERDAMQKVLSRCPDFPLITS